LEEGRREDFVERFMLAGYEARLEKQGFQSAKNSAFHSKPRRWQASSQSN